MFEYQMNMQLKYLQAELKRCAFEVLIGKDYTVDKAESAIQRIKNFNVFETETGFRIETIVDDFKITVFYHNDETKVEFYSKLNKEEQTEKERIQKLENWLSTLQSLVDVNTEDINAIHGTFKSLDTLNDDIESRLNKIEKHDKFNRKTLKILQDEYTQLIKCNNRNATTLNDLYNTIKNYGCGLSERLLEKEQRENPS